MSPPTSLHISSRTPPPVKKNYFDLPSARKEACKNFIQIKVNIYDTTKYPSLKNSRDDDYFVCECKYEHGVDSIDKACGSKCINRILMIECNKKDCPCGDHCTNNIFQQRNYAEVDVFRSGEKGYGLRAMQEITKDSFLLEYTGEIIPKEVFPNKQSKYANEGIHHFYFMSLNAGELIDATKKGCLARFINHSCNPNCYVEKWTVNRRPRIGIFAKRNIQVGEELTFNYNTERHGLAPQKCLCGEDNCCGTLGGKSDDADTDTEEEILPLENPNKVPEFIRLMLDTLENREDVILILSRLEVTTNKEVWYQFKKLHGLLVLKAYLVQWKKDDEIALKTLKVLPNLDILCRNTVTDCHILEKMEIFKERSPEMKALVEMLTEKWMALPPYWRIPKKPQEQIERERREEEERERQEKEAKKRKWEEEKREQERIENYRNSRGLFIYNRDDRYPLSRNYGNDGTAAKGAQGAYSSDKRNSNHHNDHERRSQTPSRSYDNRDNDKNSRHSQQDSKNPQTGSDKKPRYESSRDFYESKRDSYDSYRPIYNNNHHHRSLTSSHYRPSSQFPNNHSRGTASLETPRLENKVSTSPGDQKSNQTHTTDMEVDSNDTSTNVPPPTPPPTTSLPDLASLPPVPKTLAPGSLPPNWCEVVSEDGQKYYVNAVTQKTQWERPTVNDETINGTSKAAVEAVIERATVAYQQQLAANAAAAAAVSAATSTPAQKTTPSAAATSTLTQSQFKAEIGKFVVDRASRWKKEFSVDGFKKHAKTITHLVIEKEMKRRGDASTFNITDNLKARVKLFTTNYVEKLLSRGQGKSSESHSPRNCSVGASLGGKNL